MGSKFKYRPSQRIVNWGCSFDSLTEVKYVIAIMDEYQYIRERISIYYDPRTRQPTDYIRGNHRRYTPDFLIRHKQTKKAFWIEIKPRTFENDPRLGLLKEVANNYIQWKKYDWEFKIIFDDEIILNADQWEQFEQCRKLKSLAACKQWLNEFNRRYDKAIPSLWAGVPKESDLRFVMFGISQAEFNFFAR